MFNDCCGEPWLRNICFNLITKTEFACVTLPQKSEFKNLHSSLPLAICLVIDIDSIVPRLPVIEPDSVVLQLGLELEIYLTFPPAQKGGQQIGAVAGEVYSNRAI